MIDKEFIKRLRAKTGLNQTDFAILFDTSRQTIYNWEHGYVVPDKVQTGILMNLNDRIDFENSKVSLFEPNIKKFLISMVAAGGAIMLINWLTNKK